MDITNAQRARVLVHALPYIQDYSGKIVVVKYGGNAMISEHLKDSVIRDICLLQLIGVKVVLVHGLRAAAPSACLASTGICSRRRSKSRSLATSARSRT